MMLVRAIKPAHAFQSSVFREDIDCEMTEIKKDIKADFERTTATLKHKPKFKAEVRTVGTQSVTVEVSTKDKIYGYLDQGTRAHMIYPKKAKALKFKENYNAKTEPNVILSVPGGASGEELFARSVFHPGTAARNFSTVIKKSYSKDFRRRVQNALDRAARRSGHSRK